MSCDRMLGLDCFKYKIIHINYNSTHLIKLIKLLNFNLLISCWVHLDFACRVKNCQSLYIYIYISCLVRIVSCICT